MLFSLKGAKDGSTNTIHGSLKHFGGATRVGRDIGVNTIHRSLKQINTATFEKIYIVLTLYIEV